MEGDLLGLGFGSAAPINPEPQRGQPSVSGFSQLPSNPVPISNVQLPPPTVILSPPPPVQQTPSVVHQTPPVIQSVSSNPVSSNPVSSNPVSSNPVSSQPSDVPARHSTSNDQSAANIQSTSLTDTVWKPSPLQDEPKDPVLKEIKDKFGGRWKLVRSDPYDEYLKAAGVGIFARKLAATGLPEQHISIKGNSVHIDFHSTFHNQLHVFKLEETVENLVEKSRQSVFCSYKDGKLTLLMTPLEPGLNRTQEVQRFINEHGELVLIYTCGTATCRRYFAKMADLVAPLNIVA